MKLTDEQIDAIFDAHQEAPTMSFRYLVTRAIEEALADQMHAYARATLAEQAAEREVARWIPVTERLPAYEEGEKVLAYTQHNDFGGVQFHHIKATDFYEFDPDGDGEPGTDVARCVTHWMPEPWPPAGERRAAAPKEGK